MSKGEGQQDPHEENDYPLPPSRPFLITLVIIFIALAILIAKPYLGAVVLALLTAFIVEPLYRRLRPHVRWPTLAASIMLVFVLLVIVAPIAFVVWQTIDELAAIVEFFSDPEQVQQQFGNLLANLGADPSRATEIMTMVGERVAGFIASAIVPTITFLFKALLDLVVYLFVLFFAIRDGRAWVEDLKEYIPLSPEDKDLLFEGARDSVWAILMGTFVVSVFQGAVAGLGWWLFGFPAPVFWGFVMVLLSVLPFLGPFMVTIPAAGYALYQGDYFSGIGLLIWTLSVVALSDDVLRPYLIGRGSGAHPVFILVGILGGVALFGIAGFIIGPLVFALLVPIIDVWAKRRRARAARKGILPGRSMP